MPRDLSWSDFSELLSARRAQYIAGEINGNDMLEFLYRNGYTATEAKSEMADLSAAWLANLRNRRARGEL